MKNVIQHLNMKMQHKNMYKIKSRSTISALLSVYAPWLKTHREKHLTGNDSCCSLLHLAKPSSLISTTACQRFDLDLWPIQGCQQPWKKGGSDQGVGGRLTRWSRVSMSAAQSTTRGFGGMHPQENFLILAPKWWILRVSLWTNFFCVCVHSKQNIGRS